MEKTNEEKREWWEKDLEYILTEWETGQPVLIAFFRILSRERELVNFIKHILEKEKIKLIDKIKERLDKLYENSIYNLTYSEGIDDVFFMLEELEKEK
jgi:predicted nucleotide-binding protein (sugar kinase/HSP70/actin superfamily)